MNSQIYNFSVINNRIILANQGGVPGSFLDYSSTSAFQPLFSFSHSNTVGYQALCRA